MVTTGDSQEYRSIKFSVFGVFSGKIFRLTDYSGSKGKVVSIIEVANPIQRLLRPQRINN
jgi:hypothetical protein